MDELGRLRCSGGGGSAADTNWAVHGARVEELEAALVDDPNIDGVVPVLFEVVPVINPGTGLS